MIRAAAIQLNSSTDIDHNLANILHVLNKLHQSGIELAVLPENCMSMGVPITPGCELVQRVASGEVSERLSAMAARFGIVLVAGTLPVEDSKTGKIYSQSQVFSEAGSLLGVYNKVHLFDVSLPDSDESYKESDTYLHGDSPLVVDTMLGKVGLAICYDLRFPEFFRRLIDSDAQIICLPAAFTFNTGMAHWDVLLRARAIENQVAIVASNQTGNHADGRQTYGHSCVVDAWGTVLSSAGETEEYATATIDLVKQQSIRQRFPVLSHRRV